MKDILIFPFLKVYSIIYSRIIPFIIFPVGKGKVKLPIFFTFNTKWFCAKAIERKKVIDNKSCGLFL